MGYKEVNIPVSINMVSEQLHRLRERMADRNDHDDAAIVAVAIEVIGALKDKAFAASPSSG